VTPPSARPERGVADGSGSVLRPRTGTSAKAVLLTILGNFVLAPKSAWTQTLIDALDLVGVEERNARQAISRLTEQDLLTGRREGRRVRRHLTPDAVDLLDAGSKRIFGFGAAPSVWDGHWLVVLCSVPEEHRSKRHLLRSRLAFAGFGFLSAGVAITPHLEREAFAVALLDELGLAANAVLFRAEVGGELAASDLLDRAWRLDTLADEYRAFVRAFQDRSPSSPRAQFVGMIELVHSWRRFPFIDPEIPDELLPASWFGHRAREVFDEKHAAWARGSQAYFDELEESAARV
jgi:phenylacetic acid degradation operon negative regulatory protein